MTANVRMFPIMRGEEGPAGEVPWAIAELAYEHWVACGWGSQSLDQIASRGGFSWYELRMCLERKDFFKRPTKVTV